VGFQGRGWYTMLIPGENSLIVLKLFLTGYAQ